MSATHTEHLADPIMDARSFAALLAHLTETGACDLAAALTRHLEKTGRCPAPLPEPGPA